MIRLPILKKATPRALVRRAFARRCTVEVGCCRNWRLSLYAKAPARWRHADIGGRWATAGAAIVPSSLEASLLSAAKPARAINGGGEGGGSGAGRRQCAACGSGGSDAWRRRQCAAAASAFNKFMQLPRESAVIAFICCPLHIFRWRIHFSSHNTSTFFSVFFLSWNYKFCTHTFKF